jgi:hypothetical protein
MSLKTRHFLYCQIQASGVVENGKVKKARLPGDGAQGNLEARLE